MQFDIAFVSWVKILLDLLSLSNFLSLNPVPPKIKIICFWFQKVKNDWLWIKVFERFITILNISVDIIWDLFFQLVLIFEKLDSKVERFSTEQLKILNNTLCGMCTYLFLITLCNMPRGLWHSCKLSNNEDVLFEQIIGLCKFTATGGFFLVRISWYWRDEWKEITRFYRRYM